ncbi:MAG TPA: phenylalanine--tRNA ligase subunit beta [Puia sp.]|nr:phenylalanine--tRNA ligase subunit beta [Puia sp.]
MTISYNWLCEYLPEKVSPEKLSGILTGIGLEVESLETYESIKGSLEDLVVGEVLTCEKHPNADKLKLTTVKVDDSGSQPLQIVCGAPNVAAGQKVIVAKPGVTIYPTSGEPFTLQVAKIRGVESHGMICAPDEIGLGTDHAGILILDPNARTGAPVANYFKPYKDYIFEIGLTPNHMDAMSHIGVVRDVCAYLSHHGNRDVRPNYPYPKILPGGDNSLPIAVIVENSEGCPRYSGISIRNIKVAESPQWLRERLSAVGVRPISNIVDITNFVLHETGQPLHAFDADEIHGGKIIVKNLREGTPFVTLDGKERKLSAEDVMICSQDEPICIAGVFGGLGSGIRSTTKNIFLESACINAADVRKTSVRHGLRTDAAGRFEKGTDISNTVNVLRRAAALIVELGGGEIASDAVDVYPGKRQKQEVRLDYDYLKKLSGKSYPLTAIKKILLSLGFEVTGEDASGIMVAAPFHKPDIILPADVVEEIMRIDGLDNIEIPSSIYITPSTEKNQYVAALRDKVSDYLAASGFNEILTNSITNSAFLSSSELVHSVKMINNLSAELNVMRPSMLETGLEAVAYNLNRKASNLCLFEFGKTYGTESVGRYREDDHLFLYSTGASGELGWRNKSTQADIYFMKGICEKIFALMNVESPVFTKTQNEKYDYQLSVKKGPTLVELGRVAPAVLRTFGIKQPVYVADMNWNALAGEASSRKIEFSELPRQLPVHRDLALVVDSTVAYESVEEIINALDLERLESIRLFDIFESEKIGAGKKSLALALSFADQEKTMTDEEIDRMMNKIMLSLKNKLNAEIRRQ